MLFKTRLRWRDEASRYIYQTSSRAEALVTRLSLFINNTQRNLEPWGSRPVILPLPRPSQPMKSLMPMSFSFELRAIKASFHVSSRLSRRLLWLSV